ncbi:hypothetical protein PACTADRAFT_62890 [Pachysolen tannophilus NRRL Y-2460]|uniref:Formate dehydrogenase n=1 Tax=Pachysolen tannophilus NRRL Y-2460 TaxID=669874 RepID=A0A1E4U0T0_PACTA|nr:hypothetical protein PACTADRAFT_62890 [Pachysolen tannophilus NRRL Y-2460]
MKVLLILYSAGKHAADEPKLLGCTENELGIRKWLESQGHTLVTTSHKDGPNNDLDKHIVDSDIVITTPFHPGYITKERIDKAKKLKLLVVAGVGSDHIDLDYINKSDKKISVLEVTGSNVVSVAEHVVMTMLVLVRNFVPAHEMIMRGDWDVAEVAKDTYDLENKVIATVGCGRIGYRVLERLVSFNPKELLYYDYQALPKEAEEKVGAKRVIDLEELLGKADVVTINCPLHDGTKGLFNKQLISKMKKGAWLVNTARGAICVAEDVAEAVQSGQLRGYGGDVWNVQPAPKDHPWRKMANKYHAGNAMTPHVSGTSLDAQIRYAQGTKDILESFLSGKKDYKQKDVILLDGHYITKAYGEHKK